MPSISVVNETNVRKCENRFVWGILFRVIFTPVEIWQFGFIKLLKKEVIRNIRLMRRTCIDFLELDVKKFYCFR
jgi:hypothetical protein